MWITVVVVYDHWDSLDACLRYLDSDVEKEQGLVLDQLVPEDARVSTFIVLVMSD